MGENLEKDDEICGYLAPEGLEEQTQKWLVQKKAKYGQLILAEGSRQFSPFAQNIWFSPQIAQFSSINDAVKILKSIQRDWVNYSYQLHRRTALIQEKLPKTKFDDLSFSFHSVSPRFSRPLGSFTLIDQNTMLLAPSCSSPFPNGQLNFVENRVDPPSRAYLKLFEAFTLLGKRPQKGETCLELGASPGGWTWVLANLEAQVIAVDKAALDASLDKYKNVHFNKGNAFQLLPENFKSCDWLFSDIICYPDKLFDYVETWLKAAYCRYYLLTLKFQGETQYDTIEKFSKIPGSQLFHLNANKHELTWFYERDCSLK